MSIKPLQSSHTLVEKFGERTAAPDGQSQDITQYKTPVTTPFMTFMDDKELLDFMKVTPLIEAMKRHGTLKTNDDGVTTGFFPPEDPSGFKDGFFQQVALEIDPQKGCATLEHENGHYALGMICCPTTPEYQQEHAPKWMVSEFYVADSALINRIALSTENQPSILVIHHMNELFLGMNESMAKLDTIPENDRAEAWDIMKTTFTNGVAQMADMHHMLENVETQKQEL